MAIGETARLIASLELKDQFSPGIGRATTSLGRLQGGMSQVGKGAGQVSAGLLRVGSIAATGAAVGIGLAVKSAADFDAKMTESVAIMGDVSDALRNDMSDAARDVARTTTFSASEAAEAYYFLASAGLDATASIAAMPAVAQFAQAGMFDLATATDLATDAQSALGLAVRDDAGQNLANLTRVTDVLVKANTLANASVEQFSEALTNKAGAALKSVGKDVEEGVAVLAAFADQGVKGQLAGNALAIVMRDLQTAAIKHADAFKDAGVAVFDANGEFRDMADVVGDLEGALAGMSDEQKKATLAQLGFADRSQAFILTLLGTSENIRGYEDALRSAGGATEEVANKQLESFSSQLAILKHNLQDAGITIGTALLPNLTELTKEFSAFLAKPETIEGIKKFADSLATGFRQFTDRLKETDFSGIIGSFKIMAEVGKKVVDVFLSLPPGVQSALITGLAVNKLSGGLVGQGAGNIAGGLLKIVFQRGTTPANPLFVADVAGGLGGAGGAAGAGRSLLGTAAKFVLGPAVAVAIGSEIAAAINEPNIAVGRNFANEQIQARIDTGQAADIIAALHAVEDQQNTGDLLAQTSLIASNIPFIGDALGHVGPELEAQRQTLLDQLAEMGLTREEAEAIAARADRNHVEALAAQNTTINEFRTGRAEAAASAATIAGKADAQRAAIGRGFAESDDVAKTAAARVADRVQQARDAIGTGNAIARGVHGAVESSINEFRLGRTEIAAKTAAVAERVAAARDATRTGFQASNEKLGVISRKDFSPTVNVNTTIQSQVSIDAVNRAIVRSESRTTVGGGFLERAD